VQDFLYQQSDAHLSNSDAENPTFGNLLCVVSTWQSEKVAVPQLSGIYCHRVSFVGQSAIMQSSNVNFVH